MKLWSARAGVDAGSRLRVRGEGNVGRKGGEPGDLYVFISVKPHPAGLRREGTTIHSEVEISFVDAILGTTSKVSMSGFLVQRMCASWWLSAAANVPVSCPTWLRNYIDAPPISIVME